MTATRQEQPVEVPVAVERVLAALEALGWPDDRGNQYADEPCIPPEAHYQLAEEVVRAVDQVGVDPDVYADNQRLRRELDQARAQLAVVQRDRDTFQQVARGNRRHVAVLTGLIERVCQLTVDGEGKPKDPALIVYVGDLRGAIEAPIPAAPADVTEWAIRVTLRDGTVSVRHEDDPFTERSVAEHYANHARLGSQVATAEVVCRDVWHGQWRSRASEENEQ